MKRKGNGVALQYIIHIMQINLFVAMDQGQGF